MTDKIFPEDNEKTQMMAAPPPIVKPTPLDQTQLISAPPPVVNTETATPIQTTTPIQSDDNPPNFSPPPGGGNAWTPSGNSGGGASGRAIASLVLALASLICCCGFFTSIPAIILGRMEESAINRGEAPEAGRTWAKIGWILGIVMTLLGCLSYTIMLLWGGTLASGFSTFLQQLQTPPHFSP